MTPASAAREALAAILIAHGARIKRLTPELYAAAVKAAKGQRPKLKEVPR